MTDAERVLAVLIHDVRTPLGVAHGYLRLVRGNRLPSPEERDKALAGTQEALARISRLCLDAGAFLEDPPDPATGRVPASHLAARVVALLAERGVVAVDPPALPGLVAVGTSVDRTAEAIATLLAARAKAPGTTVSVETDRDSVRFSCRRTAGNGTADAAPDPPAQPLDPWDAALGLGVIVAHRLVTSLGGRVWSAGHGLALALAMPMETGKE